MKRLLIDGKLVETERTVDSINPATGEVIGQAAEATVEHTTAAVKAARKAFDTTNWSTDVAFRVQCLNQLHDVLLKHKEELRELTIAEVGHPRMITDGPALGDPINLVKYYADLAAGYQFTQDLGTVESRGAQHHRWVEREPAGVVSAIVAYNYPTQLALAKLAPALAAGCTVILKGAPDTPLLALALAELIANETDIPPGVVNVITSLDIDAAEVLTSHPDVDLVTFTGSTAVGRRIMEVASRTVKKVFLELGGKSALVVLDDANHDMAAMMAAFTICSHAGQGCAITSRLVVPRAQHDAIVEKVAATLAQIKVGDPSAPDTYMGPLISEKQRDKVDNIVQRAITAGATLVTGGQKINPGYFYTPTLLANVDPDSEIAQEEIFGPVLAVIPHDGDDHAIAIANNSIFGLSGSVLSADTDRALNVARRIRSGTISVNGGSWYAPDAPFGGYKQSGIGRESGLLGLEEFLEVKTIATPAGT
ncbi:aldehyde dehydrogenase family protein [Parafrankia discariae]|uniref:aldehyde dehydrogenase family protein n=1 Tax=Parafrankia discariae TaxID=365528 RepID=UPI0003615549|nr:aldehyde dehydrogenase family protein [Parafrankia discariae]